MVAASVAAILALGCKQAPDEEADPPKRAPVVFSGKVDDSFVGNWKTADGRSALGLAKDGKLTIFSILATPQGDRNSTVSGSWLASGGKLLLKYPQKGQDDVVLEYSPTLVDNKLTLVQPGGRLKTTYLRK